MKLVFSIHSLAGSVTASAVLQPDGQAVAAVPQVVGVKPGEVGLTVTLHFFEAPVNIPDVLRAGVADAVLAMGQALLERITSDQPPSSGFFPQLTSGTIVNVDGMLGAVDKQQSGGLWVYLDVASDLEDTRSFLRWEQMRGVTTVDDRETLQRLAEHGTSTLIREAARVHLERLNGRSPNAG